MNLDLLEKHLHKFAKVISQAINAAEAAVSGRESANVNPDALETAELRN